MDRNKITMYKLKDIARDNNLKKWSKLKKDDLINYILAEVPSENLPLELRSRRPPSPRPQRPPSPRPQRES